MRKMTVYMTDHKDDQYCTEEDASCQEKFQELLQEIHHQFTDASNLLLSHNQVAKFIINHYKTVRTIMERQRGTKNLDKAEG